MPKRRRGYALGGKIAAVRQLSAQFLVGAIAGRNSAQSPHIGHDAAPALLHLRAIAQRKYGALGRRLLVLPDRA